MTFLQGLFAASSAVVLFLYGLQGFSRELQEMGKARLKTWLERLTANRALAFLIGAPATAIVQSSSAITSLAVTLVDSREYGFNQSKTGTISAVNGRVEVDPELVFKA